MKRKWNNTIEIIALGLTAVTVSMAIFSLLTVDDFNYIHYRFGIWFRHVNCVIRRLREKG